MFLLKKISFLCAAGSMILMMNACASAVFPEIEDEDEVIVGEGGRVVKTLPKEGDSLKADTENAVYEGQEESEKAEVSEILAEDVATPAKTTAVMKDDDLSEAEPFDIDDTEAGNLVKGDSEPNLDLVTSEDNAPSVSYRLDTFYFDNGSSILDSKYNSQIRKIVKLAKEKNASVAVYGFASSRTRNTDPMSHKLANFKVSSERAESVAAALRRAGMPSAKISVEAFSDSAPLYQEVMPEGERLNRRAEVYISY